MTQEFTLTTEDGDEYKIELPVRFDVCPSCEGVGTHLHPAIGEHAYTVEEFAEEFDDEERGEYFRQGGRYDVQCKECGGQRVVSVVDVDRCVTAEQKLALLDMEREKNDRMYEDAERRMEMRFGA
jgi:hypothetical protein